MKTYYIGYNHYWKTAGISFDTVPTGLYYLYNFVEFICSKFPEFDLPNIKFKLKDKESYDWTDNKDGWTTLRDWFGDTQALFHSYICEPLFQFTNKHTKFVWIDFPYKFLKEKFPDEFGEDDSEYDEDEILEMKKVESITNFLNIEYKNIYQKLNHHYLEKSLK